MILTVTLNSALDRLLFLDEFRPGTTMRPQKMVEAVGGKGFDVSVVLQTLQAGNLALGVVAGLTGQQLVKLLDGYGLTYDLVWVEGETRIAHVLIETRHHRHSHVIAGGLSVPAEAYQNLLARCQAHLGRVKWVIASGSLAAGVPVEAYQHLVHLAHQAGVPSLIDSSGPPVLATLAEPPTILKMNEQEFEQTFALQAGTMEVLISAGQRLRAQYQLPALVITCGPRGTLLFMPEAAYLATIPPQQAVNAAGAGDAVSAALVWRRLAGDNWQEALRWAVATGAAVVLTEGTADCRWADIERLLPQAQVSLIT
jgi:1-phosphofructokinase family hexose kinase